MGTLFDQSVRAKYNVDTQESIDEFKEMWEHFDRPSLEVPVFVEYLKVKAINRLADVYVDNGDRHDEQMHGMGELVQSLIEKLEG